MHPLLSRDMDPDPKAFIPRFRIGKKCTIHSLLSSDVDPGSKHLIRRIQICTECTIHSLIRGDPDPEGIPIQRIRVSTEYTITY